MEKIDLSWDTLLIEGALDLHVSAEFLNGLFYSDRLHYSPIEYKGIFRFLVDLLHGPEEKEEFIGNRPLEIVKIIRDGTKPHQQVNDLMYEYVQDLVSTTKRNIASMDYPAEITSKINLELIAKEFLQQTIFYYAIRFNPDIKIDIDLTPKMKSITDIVHNIPGSIKVIDVNVTNSSIKQSWNPYRLSDLLRKALVKTKLLPDVSLLSLKEVSYLKQDLASDFDPFRAELLKLSSNFKSMLKEGLQQSEIEAEAANLVIYEVEPVLRMYSSMVEDRLNNKFNNYAKKTLNVLAFTGLGFFFPNMFAQAAKSAVDVVGDALTEDKDIKTGTEISRFAMKLNSYAK